MVHPFYRLDDSIVQGKFVRPIGPKIEEHEIKHIYK